MQEKIMSSNYEPMTGKRWSGVSEQAKELARLLGLGTITFKPEINQHYLLRVFLIDPFMSLGLEILPNFYRSPNFSIVTDHFNPTPFMFCNPPHHRFFITSRVPRKLIFRMQHNFNLTRRFMQKYRVTCPPPQKKIE